MNDTERINWLESRGDLHLMQDYESGEFGIGEYQGNVNDREFVTLIRMEHQTLRGAIDAAMRKPAGASEFEVLAVKGVGFPRNPERDATGNAVLYPGARDYVGVAGCFRCKELDIEVVILAPTAEALKFWVKHHEVVDELDRSACRVTKLEPLR